MEQRQRPSRQRRNKPVRPQRTRRSGAAIEENQNPPRRHEGTEKTENSFTADTLRRGGNQQEVMEVAKNSASCLLLPDQGGWERYRLERPSCSSVSSVARVFGAGIEE